MKNNPEKTLGDVIQEALKRASAAPEGAAAEKCSCMHCSGSTVTTRTIKTKGIEVSVSEGSSTNGEAELELTLTVFPADDATVIRITGDDSVDEFVEIMQELFA